jgi:hypothetical protein
MDLIEQARLIARRAAPLTPDELRQVGARPAAREEGRE